jgi:hypothetical protein
MGICSAMQEQGSAVPCSRGRKRRTGFTLCGPDLMIFALGRRV